MVWTPPSLGRQPAEGVRRRYFAGLQSLLDRAYLRVELEPLGSEQCSPYGDRDALFRVRAGDEGGPEYGLRRARVEGVLVLHITVGGRPVWELREATITVWSREGDDSTRFELEPEHADLLAARIVSEIAAHLLLRAAPCRDWADMVTPWDERGFAGALEDARETLAWAGLAPGGNRDDAEEEGVVA